MQNSEIYCLNKNESIVYRATDRFHHNNDSAFTQKNVRRIINSRKGFITEKFVYERALPLDKPFFLEKTEKGLPYVAK